MHQPALRAAAILVAALLETASGSASAQAPAPPAAAPSAAAQPALGPSSTDWRAVDPSTTLQIETTKGRIVVELRPELAPNHVARIKALARRGYYDGALFYRVIKGFMAQTGDKGQKQFRSDLPNLKGEYSVQLPPQARYVALASSPAGDLGFIGAMPVAIEPGLGQSTAGGQARASGRAHALFCPGVVAMAHDATTGAANSQFFLMRGRAPTLEKAFSAFGRVLVGQEVVDAIEDGAPPPNPDKMTRVRVLSDVPASQRPAIQVMDTTSASFAALVQTTMTAKGPAFSLCDVQIPVRMD